MDKSDRDDDNLITTVSTLITGFQHTCNENSVEENESEDKSLYINSRKDTSLKNQIKEIRNAKHKIYIEKNKENENDDIANNNNNKWPKNTILITRDSILNNIQESRTSNKFKVEVRALSGADIQDMSSYITPLIKEEPKYAILYIGCDDNKSKSSSNILDGILKLKCFMEERLPGVRVTISCPIDRLPGVRVTISCTIERLPGVRVTISCTIERLPGVRVTISCPIDRLPGVRVTISCPIERLPGV